MPFKVLEAPLESTKLTDPIKLSGLVLTARQRASFALLVRSPYVWQQGGGDDYAFFFDIFAGMPLTFTGGI